VAKARSDIPKALSKGNRNCNRISYISGFMLCFRVKASFDGQRCGMGWQGYRAPRGLVEATTRNHRKAGRADAELSWLGTGFWPLIALDNPTHESDLSNRSYAVEQFEAQAWDRATRLRLTLTVFPVSARSTA